MGRLIKLLTRLWKLVTPKKVIGGSILLAVITVLGLAIYLQDKNIAILNPQGIIADKQLSLLIFTTILGLVVVVPVFAMLFGFAWKYREGNKKAKYTPDEDGNRLFEALWWGIPIIIIIILSIVTWFSTHDLDPYKPLKSNQKPITIQVVALQWRWLFIYPDQKIATINEVRFPENTPINFEITADAPMSAFWIPSLGSQTYAMNGMASQLKLQANGVGEYQGTNTNINGEGYSKMTFKAISLTRADFDKWVDELMVNESGLHLWEYEELAVATEDTKVHYFSLHDDELFGKIMMKYMDGGGEYSHDMMEAMERQHTH